MSKYRTLFKDIGIFAIGSIGSKLVLFFMVPLYTNCLSTEQYGVTELIYTFQQLIVPFVSLVIFDAVIRFGLSKNEKKENVLKCSLFILAIGATLTVCVTPLLNLYSTISTWRWFVCVYVLISMLLSVLQNYLKVLKKNLFFAIVSIGQTIVLAVSNILFLLIADYGITGYMLSIFLSHFVAIVFCCIFGRTFSELKKGKLDWNLLKRMIIFSAPLILNNISWWIIHSSDRIMVELMISTAALGIYTVAAKIPSLINVVTSIFQQAWGISSIKEIENDNDKTYYSNVFLYLFTFVFFASICIMLVLKAFMSIYVGKDFFEAWLYVPLLLVGACFSTISSYFGSLYGALKKSVNNMITTIVAALINIAVNFVCIHYFGIIGAAIGTATAYFVVAIIRMADCNRYVKFDLHLVYFFVDSGLVITLAILISAGINIYISSVVAIALFLIFNAKTIYGLVKSIIAKFGSKKNQSQEVG